MLDSALATIRRYATATQHLIDFASAQAIDDAMALDVAAFISHLRQLEVAPNGQTTWQAGMRERADLQRLLKDRIDVIAPEVLVIAEEFSHRPGPPGAGIEQWSAESPAHRDALLQWLDEMAETLQAAAVRTP